MNCSAQMSTLTDCVLWFYAQQTTAQIRKCAPACFKVSLGTNWYVILTDHVGELNIQRGFREHT